MEIKPKANSTQNGPGTGLKPRSFPLRGDSSQHAPQTLHSSYSLSAFACFDVLFSYICQDRFFIFLTASYQRESDPVGSIDCAERLNVIEAAAWTWLHIVFNIWALEERWRKQKEKKPDWFNKEYPIMKQHLKARKMYIWCLGIRHYSLSELMREN